MYNVRCRLLQRESAESPRVRVKFRGARNSIIVPPGYMPPPPIEQQRGADVKLQNSELYTHTHTHTRTGYALGRVSRKTQRRDGGHYA